MSTKQLVFVPKYTRNLLERQPVGVRPKLQNQASTKAARDDEAEVVPPANILKRRRRRLKPHDVEETDARRPQRDTLGPEMEGEDFA